MKETEFLARICHFQAEFDIAGTIEDIEIQRELRARAAKLYIEQFCERNIDLVTIKLELEAMEMFGSRIHVHWKFK